MLTCDFFTLKPENMVTPVAGESLCDITFKAKGSDSRRVLTGTCWLTCFDAD